MVGVSAGHCVIVTEGIDKRKIKTRLASRRKRLSAAVDKSPASESSSTQDNDASSLNPAELSELQELLRLKRQELDLTQGDVSTTSSVMVTADSATQAQLAGIW